MPSIWMNLRHSKQWHFLDIWGFNHFVRIFFLGLNCYMEYTGVSDWFLLCKTIKSNLTVWYPCGLRKLVLSKREKWSLLASLENTLRVDNVCIGLFCFFILCTFCVVLSNFVLLLYFSSFPFFFGVYILMLRIKIKFIEKKEKLQRVTVNVTWSWLAH